MTEPYKIQIDVHEICRRCDQEWFSHHEHEGMMLCPFTGLSFASATKCPTCGQEGKGTGVCSNSFHLTYWNAKAMKILREAYEHFKMKSELSFMVVAGMYLSPKQLTEKDIEWAKEKVKELNLDK